MPTFNDFNKAIQQQFDKMVISNLFTVEVDKNTLWDLYLSSFPKGSNPIYKERTEHDCQCCKQFIRTCGNVVTIEDNKLISIWDINIGGHYQIVADALSKKVKEQHINNIFLHYQNKLGTEYNHQLLFNGNTIKWNHFYYELPSKFILTKGIIPNKLGKYKTNKEILKRALDEISLNAIGTVLELIEQNSIYRGQENKTVVERLLTCKINYDKLLDKYKDNYSWNQSSILGAASKIRNTSIGTLLIDISNEIELDIAVKKFEAMVAPQNYKRPSALITKSMINNAQKKVEELGITSALQRRYAILDDITINNLIYVDRTTKQQMNVFDSLASNIPENINKLKKVDEVSIENFIKDILPKAESIEIYFDNKHINNLVSLIAPSDPESKNMLKWNNNFTWSYNGEVTDSMKQRVAKAGGNVSGVLRFSIQWNDGDNNQNDFDAHCIEPNNNKIYYSNKGRKHSSSGMLDVDIVTPGNKIAVENITWSDINKMQEGEYHFLVHNYSNNGGRTGFTAEIEYDGVIYSYDYPKNLKDKEKVTVAKINFSKEKGITFIKSLSNNINSKELWGINTNQFHKVNIIMNSPNHWDNQQIGNKHLFFVLDNCNNEKSSRGFYNEFLNNNLIEHRKVFEVLSSQMKTEKSNNQLSGIGFSSTQKNSVLCKVTGSFNRIIKINF